jgi:hypothetical protein
MEIPEFELFSSAECQALVIIPNDGNAIIRSRTLSRSGLAFHLRFIADHLDPPSEVTS